ncbi:hypothetical protein [Methylomonas sp. AM2-LC]|uniref:hypothetical protein n=1 Tax=Methylomonas sp. AM2-LC TaxID=3153301 RepID=UPI003265B7B3
MANKYILKGSGVEIEYTLGETIGLPVLTYKSGAFIKSFTANEVQTDDTGLGELVSVPLLLTIDAGGKRFGFYLPFINVPHGETASFHSVGIYETFSGPSTIPHRPSTWRCIELSGTAQTVIVPL